MKKIRGFKFPNKDALRLYNDIYDKWIGELVRYDINMFTWEGLPCEQSTHELMLLKGYDGAVIDSKQGFIIVKGGLSGVTNYTTEFSEFVYATPLTSGSFKINKNGTVCRANPIYDDAFDCIDNYANLLTHIDLTIQTVLINMRATNAFSAKNEAQKDTVLSWLRSMRRGKTEVIVDKENLASIYGENGIITLPTYNVSHNTLSELYSLRQNILRDYFTERGFIADKGKSERLVSDELSINIYRTMYGISDMYRERKEFCERTKNVLGKELHVNYNEYILREIEDTFNTEVTVNGTNKDSGAITEDATE